MLAYAVLVTAIALLAAVGIVWTISGEDFLRDNTLVVILCPLVIAPPIAVNGWRMRQRIWRLNERLTFALEHDHLTRARTRQSLSDAYRAMSDPKVLMMLDADHFKRLNDEHGHAAGDLALVHLARSMERVVREGDVVGRWGGEEFVIVLSDARLQDGVRTARRLISHLNESPVRCAGTEIRVTVSVGLTVCRPDEPLDDAIRRADRAAYRAKHAGRNRLVVDDPVADAA